MKKLTQKLMKALAGQTKTLKIRGCYVSPNGVRINLHEADNLYSKPSPQPQYAPHNSLYESLRNLGW